MRQDGLAGKRRANRALQREGAQAWESGEGAARPGGFRRVPGADCVLGGRGRASELEVRERKSLQSC